MASVFFNRLKNKYDGRKIQGKQYEEVIQDILAHNNEKIGNAIGRLSKENYENELKRIPKTKSGIVKLPDLSEVLPKRSVFLIKAAQNGKIITDDLRTSLEKNLRDTLSKYTAAGKPRMEIQRGKTTGRINTQLIADFQKAITKTYESKTKKNKNLGVPSNIKQIAITETRTTINSIKREYNQKLIEKNPYLIMMKTWIQNKRLAINPRMSHDAKNGETIPMNQLFSVAREQSGGFDYMHGPHDKKGSAENVIGCNCDIIYKVRFPA